MRPTLAIIFALFLAGCASHIVPIGNETYSVIRSAKTGFSSAGKMKLEAYQEMNEFAASKGMTAEVLNVDEVEGGFAHTPHVEVRFRLVAKK